MAAYISVPRDLARVKSKTLFNLTKRQLVCFAIAALVGIPTFFLSFEENRKRLAGNDGHDADYASLVLSRYVRKGWAALGEGRAAFYSGKNHSPQSATLPHQQLLCCPDPSG